MERTTIKKANRLHKRVGTFILSCIGSNGYPQVKAVVPPKYRRVIDEIYFCTNTSSKFTNAIMQNPKTSVYFYSRKLIWKGCSLQGDMEIVTDRDIKKQYWQNKYKNAYKEKSYADPDFCLIRFKPKTGRFYSWYKIIDFVIE